MSKLIRVVNLPAPPARPDDGHKGTFGQVLVVAGSEGMSGAACLVGKAALRGGAGLVTVAVPRCVASIVAAVEASYLTMPLPDDDGRLAELAVPVLDVAMASQPVVAIGPGLGQSEGVKAVVRHLYHQCDLPMVVDADGLNAFVGESDRLTRPENDAHRILTPHVGEFSRLTGLDVPAIQANRQEVAAEFASRHRVVVVLKGAGTIVSDGRRVAVNSTGNSGMATGGSGDVLTGLIASLVAQGMSTFAAAQLGAHLHGLAGDVAAELHTKPFVIASDLPNYLDRAWQKYLTGQ